MIVWVLEGRPRLFIVEPRHGDVNQARILDGVSFGMGLYDLEQCNADLISLRLVVVVVL
jgi:hypothetical protein